MIPIANIYFLLCYAWRHVHAGEQVLIGTDDVADVANLVAKVLLRGSRQLCRRGLHRTYLTNRETLQRIRGRIDFAETISRLSQLSGKAACEVDDLSPDNLQNQVIKATLLRLARTPQVEAATRAELAHLAKSFFGVAELDLAAAHFSRLQIHSQNAIYKFLIQLCRLAYDSMLPLQGGQGWLFSDFSRDEANMAKLFENFVYAFYEIEQTQFKVKSDIFDWVVDEPTSSAVGYLPTMRTDICLRSAGRTIVIDTKYYHSTLSSYFGKESIHSDHLYQIFSYLKNLEVNGGPDIKATGILLYPTVTTPHELDLRYKIHGHEIRVCTVNLRAHREKIRSRLLDLIDTGDSVLARVA